MVSPEDFIIRRQCTPFCETQCKYAGQHHPILVALINCVDARGFNEFTKTIAKFRKRGWMMNDPIEDPDSEFRYPLVHWATVLGNVMALKWCIDHELDLNKRWGPRSETALHRFMVCGYSALRENSDNILKTFKKLVKLLKVLLQSNDDNKDLPLHVAAKVLVERPLASDSRFDTIYTEMVKILVRKSCELDTELLNCRNLDGNTVMHIVAQHDKGCEILELLIENSAHCDLTNGDGLKPIDIARSKDATDIIAVLSKDEEEANYESSDVINVEEIGDIDIIYIESDDDMDKNNNDDKDEAYILNLLDRVKSEPEDGNDLDWTLDSSVDHSTSNDYTMDDDSYDIDGGVFSSVDEKRTLRRLWDNYPLEESSTSRKVHDKHGTGQTLNLKRKSSNVSEKERVSKKLHSNIENESSSSSRKSKETLTTNNRQLLLNTEPTSSDVNESRILRSQQHGKESSSKAKRKLSSKSSISGPEVKKQKAVSPQLNIVSLNKSAFNLLKKKIKQGSTLGKKDSTVVKSNKLSKSPKKLRRSSLRKSSEQILTESLISDGEEGVAMATKVSVHDKSSQENEFETCQEESFSKVETTRVRGDETKPNQDELTDYLSLSQVKKPVTSVTNFPTTKPVNSQFPVRSPPAIEIPSANSPEPRRPSSFEEEYVPQTPENSQRSFSSSAEISSAYLRLREKLHGSTNVNLPIVDLLRDVFDIFKPGNTPAEKPVGRSTPNPIPGPVETKTEKPVGRSTPSPVPMEHNRSKKRIEDVVTNLRERQHAGSQNTATHSRDSASESFGTMSDNNLRLEQDGAGSKSNAENISTEDQASGEQREQQAPVTTPIQQAQELVKSVQATKDNLTSGQGSNSTLEQQVVNESKSAQPEQESGISTQITNDKPAAGSNSIQEQHVAVTIASNQYSQPQQDLAKATETSKDRQPTFQVFNSNIVIKKEVDNGDYSGSLVTEQIHRNGLSSCTETTSRKQNIVQVKKEKDNGDNVYRATSQVISESAVQTVPMVSETTSRMTVPTIAEKMDVRNNESTCGGVNTTTTSCVKKTPNSEHIGSSDSLQPQAGDKINETTTSDKMEKRSNKRPTIPWNALPTQVQAGSYRAMLSAGASADTSDNSVSSSMDTPSNADGNTGEQYQSLSNTIDKFCDTIHKACGPPSSTANTSGNSVNRTVPVYSSLSYIDTICEEVYGISPGRPKQNSAKKQGETPRNDASNNAVQGQVSAQQPNLLSVTLPSQTQNSVQPPVLSHVVQLQTRGPIQVPGQAAERGRLLVVNAPQSTVQLTHGQYPVQVPIQRPGMTTRVQIRRMLGQGNIQTPMQVEQRQVPRQAQPILQQLRQMVPGSANGLRKPVPQHRYVPQVVNQANRMFIPQNTRVGIRPQNMTRPGNMIRPQIPIGHTYAKLRHTNLLKEMVNQYLKAPQNVNQVPTHHSPSVQTRPTVPSFLPVVQDQQQRYFGNGSPRPTVGQPSVSTLVRNTIPTPNTSQVNVSGTQTFKTNEGRMVHPDMATAIANKTSTDPTRDIHVAGSRGPTSQSNHTSPESVDLTSDTNNPEESEDEGLGLNGFTETDNVKDMAGTKKIFENLVNLVPRADILQLLQKTKVDSKEQIDKWTKEYEDAARSERCKYVEYEKLREKVTQEQDKLRKLIRQAEGIKKEKNDAATRKTLYHNKILEEREKIPIITEFINMFSTDNTGK